VSGRLPAPGAKVLVLPWVDPATLPLEALLPGGATTTATDRAGPPPVPGVTLRPRVASPERGALRGIWMGQRYTTEQVARIFRIPLERLRRLQREGVLPATIADGRRRYYSFQDLVAVRTYAGLVATGVDGRRVRAAVAQLRALLPEVTHPLSELRVCCDGDRIVVARTGEGRFDGESGQRLLEFEVEGLSQEVVARLEPAREAPRRADDWFERACALEDAGDLDGAEQALARALDVDPHHVAAVVNLGNLRYRRGDVDGARRQYEQALAIAPDRAEGYYNVGFLLLDGGDPRAAVPLLHAALARDPEFPDAYYNLALAYERLGQLERARTLWQRCLELDPVGSYAEDAREGLRRLEGG
jgi:Flp pilus assembly protein TadD